VAEPTLERLPCITFTLKRPVVERLDNCAFRWICRRITSGLAGGSGLVSRRDAYARPGIALPGWETKHYGITEGRSAPHTAALV